MMAATFLLLDLASIIRREKGAFGTWSSSNGRELKTPTLRLSAVGKGCF